MNILYVDYFQKDGHVNFNRIHIDALRAAGHRVTLVMHREIARQLPYPDSDYALQLPRCLRFREGRPLLNRIVFIIALLYIKMRVRVGRFDKVFLGCIDEISYSMLPLSRDAYIYAHGNGRFLPEPDGALPHGSTKLKAMQRLAPRATFIVFNDYMALPFRRAGFPHVQVVSHGCVPAFDDAPDGAFDALPFRLAPDARVVFHSSGKCNEDFLRKALGDKALHRFLADSNIHLILRNQPAWVEDLPANIHFVNGFISTALYQALFLRADAILMCYPDSFHHQVSGVSFECAANGKLMLALDTPPLSYIRDWFNYNPLFADTTAFRQRLQQLFVDVAANHSEQPHYVIPLEKLQPDYSHFFA